MFPDFSCPTFNFITRIGNGQFGVRMVELRTEMQGQVGRFAAELKARAGFQCFGSSVFRSCSLRGAVVRTELPLLAETEAFVAVHHRAELLADGCGALG
jgi:hypothetical protein